MLGTAETRRGTRSIRNARNTENEVVAGTIDRPITAKSNRFQGRARSRAGRRRSWQDLEHEHGDDQAVGDDQRIAGAPWLRVKGPSAPARPGPSIGRGKNDESRTLVPEH